MPGRHVYRVRPHEGGGWQVGKEGGSDAAIEDRTQFGE
jgi:Uncharacterized protein conserved in bacteria (DUF2188)